MIDIRQSKNYGEYLSKQGWIVERINSTNYFIKKIPIIGCILKIQRPKKIISNSINQLINKYKPFQIIIEPIDTKHESLLTKHGFKISKRPYLPTKTIQIDLTKSIKKITADFEKETRRCIKIGEKIKNKIYSSPQELKKFHNVWKKSVKINRFVPNLQSLINLRKSFPDNHSFFLTSHNKCGKIIGGAVFTRSLHDYCYYWYGFTNSEGRSLLSQYSLLYHGILWGKKMDCKIFDMEGIYDNRFPQKSWLGFSHFKKGFGGRKILYPGCFVKTNWSYLFKK